MKIGVFDSGIGGVSVAKAIQRSLPEHKVIFRDDHDHLPYGTKPPHELLGYVLPILEQMIHEGCEVLVIACNTVSTTLIGDLRQKLAVPLIAVEPMVKPAAKLTTSGVIAVCATPTTLASKRYKELKAEFAGGITVLEPDCSQWTMLIESKSSDLSLIEREINAVLDKGADVIILGCTHYHWVEKEIKKIADGRATVLQPEPAVVSQLKRVLQIMT